MKGSSCSRWQLSFPTASFPILPASLPQELATIQNQSQNIQLDTYAVSWWLAT